MLREKNYLRSREQEKVEDNCVMKIIMIQSCWVRRVGQIGRYERKELQNVNEKI